MRFFVDSPAFMAQLERDVAAARSSIHAQVMSFEGDEAGKRFASLLMGRRELERTLIIDRYSRFYISDRFLANPKHLLKASLWRERRETLRLARELAEDGVTVHWTNPLGVLFLEFISRNHKKSVVIDDRIVYLGGINVCDHNFAWRDIMLRIDDARAGAFMRDDIRATLRGENLSSRREFGDLEIALLDGESNRRLNEPVLQLLRGARASIVVQSAYVTFPFFDCLAEAAGRGVAVALVTPKDNNKPRMAAYAEWAAARAGVAVRLYDGRMSHIKALLVDDEALVVGSSNFDYLSFHSNQEVLAIVRDPAVIAQYRREVLEPDLARSVAPSGVRSDLWHLLWERSFRGAGRVAVPLCRWLRRRRAARQRPQAVVPAQAEPGVSSPE
ncbi:MAG: phosphatidylserine/phosphatidylglycerophosphate/cardiolipin synthase family protein [Vicinamibacterales bacterium]